MLARTLPLLLAATVLASGCARGNHTRTRAGASPNPVPTAIAKVTTVRGTSIISGVIAPYENVAITSSLSEPTDEVNVVQGDVVHAGEVLAVLDTTDLRAELAQAQGVLDTDIRTVEADEASVRQTHYTATLNIETGNDQVKSARAALAQAQQTLANDQLNLTRDRQLLANGYIAEQSVDQQLTTVVADESALRTATANLQTALTNQQVNGTPANGLQASIVATATANAAAARAAIEQARAQIQQDEASIAKATIVSPVDAVVTNRNLNPGEYPGSRTIFTLQELDKVYADLNASSEDTFAIPVGANVALSISGAGAQTYDGKVVAVLGQVTPGSTDFTVQVLLENPGLSLHAGLPVSATIDLAPVHGVGIPTTAFLDDTHTSVMIADDELVDVVAKTVQVRELGSDGTTSIVSGLSAGQAVISNGQLGLADGQSIAQN
ncbi:MAG TPA: efflux RND transporter periplasmic adaptor subunit [Candidatus Acidoferrales bacterium]|nr:efflux RND transporter periplasmic adaptor subunit [Candidatus Acidoferrales bacterium]